MPGKAHGHETNNLKLRRNTCFVCGPDNPEGMRLTFTLDEERSTFVCEFNLGERYTGPPGHCHGGIIASIAAAHLASTGQEGRLAAFALLVTVLDPARAGTAGALGGVEQAQGLWHTPALF